MILRNKSNINDTDVYEIAYILLDESLIYMVEHGTCLMMARLSMSVQ